MTQRLGGRHAVLWRRGLLTWPQIGLDNQASRDGLRVGRGAPLGFARASWFER